MIPEICMTCYSEGSENSNGLGDYQLQYMLTILDSIKAHIHWHAVAVIQHGSSRNCSMTSVYGFKHVLCTLGTACDKPVMYIII